MGTLQKDTPSLKEQLKCVLMEHLVQFVLDLTGMKWMLEWCVDP